MKLSENAQKVLALLPTEGTRKRNTAFLKKQLPDLSPSDIDAARNELLSSKLAELDGRRIGRAPSSTDLPGLTRTAKQILGVIPADGSSIGGASLRSRVPLDNETYSRGLRELREAGAITIGPGYGGSIRRTSSVDETPPEPPSKLLEKDLYEPFVAWLRSTWPESSNEGLQEVQQTATPKGYARKSGTWSRADIVELRIDRYHLLPPAHRIQLELSSYELKRKGTPQIEWIYEAAAQARWAHRSTLVLEAQDSAWRPDERFVGDVRRFGLGLYLIYRNEAGVSGGRSDYQVTVLMEPSLQPPEPSELHSAIERFIDLSDSPDLLQRYRGAIG
jgi:hypothetical protein